MQQVIVKVMQAVFQQHKLKVNIDEAAERRAFIVDMGVYHGSESKCEISVCSVRESTREIIEVVEFRGSIVAIACMNQVEGCEKNNVERFKKGKTCKNKYLKKLNKSFSRRLKMSRPIALEVNLRFTWKQVGLNQSLSQALQIRQLIGRLKMILEWT